MLLFYDLVLFFFVFRCCFIKTENITRFRDNIPLLLPPLKTHHCIILTFFKLDFANIVPKISFAPYKKFWRKKSIKKVYDAFVTMGRSVGPGNELPGYPEILGRGVPGPEPVF